MGTLRKILFYGLLWGGICLLSACGAEVRETEGSLIERLEHEHSAESDHVEPINIEHLLLEINTVAVDSDLEPLFHTTVRTDDMIKYPCSSCHQEPLDMSTSSTYAESAHPDIQLNHADATIMNCTSCHSSNNLDSLHSLTGQSIEFDYSYQLCAQCHTQQAEDWEGGAHGKEIGGWAPPRVIETCTSCHNPHNPQLEPRWPAVTGGGIQE